MQHLKKPGLSTEDSDRKIRESVEAMLSDIKQNGEQAVRALAKKFDGWEGDFVLSEEKKQRLIASLP
ncbi:MAG: sulfopropanediol 3-dehydrogenase, partial [Flavobacteriales bacterium]